MDKAKFLDELFDVEQSIEKISREHKYCVCGIDNGLVHLSESCFAELFKDSEYVTFHDFDNGEDGSSKYEYQAFYRNVKFICLSNNDSLIGGAEHEQD